MYPNETQNTDCLEGSITQHFAYLHGVLQNVERKIIDSLHKRHDSWNKNIDEISQQLREHEDRLQSALVVIGSITENLDKIDIQQVIRNLQKLADIPCHLVITSNSDEKEIRFNIDQTIVNTLEKHCTIHVPAASNFSLQRTELLPDDYEIEPLTEEISILRLRDKSAGMKATSAVAIAPRTNDNHPSVGVSEMVRVTHVIDPSCFYVQLIQHQNKLAELTKELAMLANTSGIIPTEVTLNGSYVVQCSRDRNWYRARVVNKRTDPNKDERYTVFFVDYGMNEENVPLSRMRNIIPTFSMHSGMALRCTLFDVVPNGGAWHPDATEAFKKLVCTNTMVSMCVMMRTGDTFYVDLCAVSSKDSGLIPVKDSLTYMKYATCVSSNTLMRMNPDSTTKYYKEQLELESYIDVEVLFVESPDCIYVQKIHSNRSYHCKMIRELTETYEHNLSSTEYIPVPHKDLPCAAPGVDKRWHRGIITDVTEISVQVFFVDLGYTLMFNYNAIRALPKKYMSCKTQAIRVSLRNIKPPYGNWDQWRLEAIEFLKKCLMHSTKPYKIVAFDKSGDTYNVVMYRHDKTNVAYLLIKNGFALNTRPSPRNANTGGKSRNRRQKHRRAINNMKEPTESEEPIEQVERIASAESHTILNTSTRSTSEETEDPFKVHVLVHQVRSPDCIYVSDAMCEQTGIEEMMKQIQEFYNKYRSTKQEVWNMDAVCAVYSANNSMYYRGKIVEINTKGNVVVFLYDIGVEETVSINDIQALYPPFFKIPTSVFKIKLSGILPCGGSSSWPSSSCQALHEIIDKNQNCRFYISKLEDEDVENSAIPVELWIKQKKMDGPLAPTRIEINSVNRMLVDKGLALPVKEYAKKRDKIVAVELKRLAIKKSERLLKSESNVKWFKINNGDGAVAEAGINMDSKILLEYSNSNSDSEEYSSEEIFDNMPTLPKLSSWLPAEPILKDVFSAVPTYLDHDGFLYLHSIEQNTKTLHSIETKLQDLYNNCAVESCDIVWAAGDMCIAQYHANQKWYRGKVVKVLGNDIFEVEFVDYGNVEECSIGTLKKKVILENIPIQCTKCLIYGLNPNNKTGKWTTEDLDKIHGLLIDKNCEVSILDATDLFYVISVTIFPNEHCSQTMDLITFLVNEWNMNIKLEIENNLSGRDTSTTDTPDVIIENSKFIYSDEEIENVAKDEVISGYSVLMQHTNALNESGSCAMTDHEENFSWCKSKTDIVTSTPHIVSEENLSINYKVIDIPQDIEYIEIELCCSITATKFHAQLKENAHSTTLTTYYEQYQLLMSDLQENACKQPMITYIAPNTPCCAKFSDGVWYRCLIVETEPAAGTTDVEIKLLYVDYGNDEYRTVNTEQCELHALKKEWMDVPVLAIKCKLWNIEVASSANKDSLLPRLKEMYNRRVVATIKKIDNDFMYIELYENEDREELIYGSLIQEGIFKRIKDCQTASLKNISQ
ncbi:PREDICTED: RING finger protein 17-like [Dufourea novaeangliae]|uniref:RING finger protein 17-like n=1 Tax=Dufourea novaeangliae TaxID=178035 RepID=UPI0007671224|nr:PREDICTED: RING finger protein 17-like [Dufourea novaeangliae]